MGIHPYVVNVEGVAAESETNNAGGFYFRQVHVFIDFVTPVVVVPTGR